MVTTEIYVSHLLYLFSALATLSSVIVFSLFHLESRNKVSKYSLLLSVMFFAVMLHMNISYLTQMLNIYMVQPFKFIQLSSLAIGNLMSIIIPPFFMYGYFGKNVPQKVQYLFWSFFSFGLITHVLHIFWFSTWRFYDTWCQPVCYLAPSVALLLGAKLYKMEVDEKKKKPLRTLVKFGLIMIPFLVLDSYLPIQHREGILKIVWIFRPLFYSLFSFFLIWFRFQLSTTPEKSEDFDFSRFVETMKLTKREEEIVALLIKGFRNKEVANLLNLKEKSVENHLTRIYRKCEVTSRVELMHLVMTNSK